jgi:hypothetical protein
MLSAMCELTGRDPADLLPREPADFFNLVGLAEWAAIDQRYADKETPSWA